MPLPQRNTNLSIGPITTPSAVAPLSKTPTAPVQKLLLPVVDLVRVDPELTRQRGDSPAALDCCQRHLRLELPTVLLLCPPYAAPALSALSRSRAPP